MPDPVTIKICGLSTPDTLAAALDAGTDMVGFVFFAPSPRNISFDLARGLGVLATGRAQKVALSVDADDALLDGIMTNLQPDLMQLHGRESAARVTDIKARYGLPVMKAIHVSETADLAAVATYEAFADMLVFDAKPPKGAAVPGGNGAAFDWTVLQDVKTRTPWMLSGGLDAANVREAIRATGAKAIDVSSGVESARGVKDAEKIAAFVKAAREGGS